MICVIATYVATMGVSISVKPDTNSEKFVTPLGLEPGSPDFWPGVLTTTPWRQVRSD